MKQVVQPIAGGPVRVVDVPRPVCGATEVLVQTVASALSPGTERAVTALAQSNLLAKAKARPDLVRQVIRKARTEGIGQTSRAVTNRLRGDVPLGYSAAGTVIEVGEYVTGVSRGQLMATGGAGKANHAELQAVPSLLCAAVPDGVGPEAAAFATVGSVAMHGLRLADVGPGSRVVVVGLGLIGQLAVRLAQAAGYQVAAIDVNDFAVSRAAGALALVEAGEETTDAVLEWSRGRGADAVLLTASGSSSSVIGRTPALCRDRASVVVVGDIGLDLQRTPFYDKELSLRFARSYGPGRHEPSYEGWGVDYPPGHVRWTEGRNLEAFLDLLAAGRLRVDDLVTHRFPLEEAPAAYALIEQRSEPALGVVLIYDASTLPEGSVRLRPARASVGAGFGVGLVGAGAFASGVLVPSLRAAGFDRLVAVASASGLSARRLAEHGGFEKAVSGPEEVVSDLDVGTVVIATPHNTHASLAVLALRQGKHVWCEKPIALGMDELDAVEAAWLDAGTVLFVGFNRRYSPAVRRVRAHFGDGGSGPLVVTYRINAPAFEGDTWPNDRLQGTRVIGEVCHFIDTCAALVGEDATSVEALGRATGGAADVAIALGFPGGSVASVTVASRGHQSVEKEHIEILGRGRSAVISDFRRVTLDGTAEPGRTQDKGHRAAASAFRSAIRRGSLEDTVYHLASSRTTLLAAERLLRN